MKFLFNHTPELPAPAAAASTTKLAGALGVSLAAALPGAIVVAPTSAAVSTAGANVLRLWLSESVGLASTHRLEDCTSEKRST